MSDGKPFAFHSHVPPHSMIAGLPWTAWLLILTAVVPPLALALAFYRAHPPQRPRRQVRTDH